jgi:glycosyltransferase involved in cell wall biosynthesis
MDNFTPCFSILICTYNPDEQIFRRTLKSVASLTIPAKINVECVIVDNNSQIPIEKIPYVREFLNSCPWAKVIQATQQGLTFARIAGIRSTKNSYVVFIDDDNEVLSSYLEALIDLFEKYPAVAAWGPGNIQVHFMETVSDWFSTSFKNIFQEKHHKHNEYGCIPETWTSFYPIGTGLAIRREVLERYCDGVESGNLSSLDRKGKSLSSGGDIQIVWEAIKMGYAAGVAPSLSVNHLISANKSTVDYVKRLSFGTASSYLPCLTSSFPDVKAVTIAAMPTTASIVRQVIKKILRYSTRFKFKLLILNLADYLGSVSGYYQVMGQHNQTLEFMIRQLKLR